MELTSTITGVTVYTDRAQVTRVAKATVEAGEQRLRFTDLPDSIERSSVQVNGTGAMILRDVAFSTVHFAEAPDGRRKQFNEERRRLKGQLRELEGKLAIAVAEKGFLDQITAKLTSSSDSASAGELDPDRWIKMVQFYRVKLEQLDVEKRDLDDRIALAREEVRRIEAQINDLGRVAEKTRNVVDVTVEAKAAAEITLTLSYIVYGPSWAPVYDLRVLTNAGKMGVTYNGMVQQSTGEDWAGVALSLSTAAASVSGEEPELVPWRIDLRRQVLRSLSSSLPSAPSPKKLMRERAEAEEEDMAKACSVAEAPPEMEVEEASVETGATAVVFAVPGRVDIPADNNPHRVSIMVQEFDAVLKYSTVPKLAPYAYLKATVTNATEYPYLPGKANVFLDSSFVAETALELVAPGAEFTVSLGVDEALKVERVFVKKFQKDEGVLSKKTKMVYEYRIEIANNRKADVDLTVKDQLPIAQNKEIVVECLEPRLGRGDSPEKDDREMLTWKLKLKPAEKKQIPLSFVVEFARGQAVEGLE